MACFYTMLLFCALQKAISGVDEVKLLGLLARKQLKANLVTSAFSYAAIGSMLPKSPFRGCTL